MIEVLFSSSTLASALRLATPLMLAAIGGAFTYHANVFNIALEGFMLISAFFSVWGTITFGSPWVGLLVGATSAMLASLLFGFLVLKLKADNIVVGLALNLGCLGLTTWLLEAIFGVRGVVMVETGGFPTIDLPLISKIPYLGNVISGQNLLVYLTLAIAIFGEYFIYRNIFGIRLRAVGEYPQAAESVGISVNGYRLYSILLSGLFAGFAGAFLTLSGASMFSENMTAGKGFIALAAVFFSQGRPSLIILASIL
ncbi:MAG: ABC transporter permease, partial [Anaerolineales bacterium]